MPHLPSRPSLPACVSLARAAFSLYCGCPAVTVSLVSDISHSRLGSSAERWMSLPPTHSKRRRPSCVRMSCMSMPPGRAAGPEVRSVGYLSAVPWQSTQSISMAAATSP